MTSSTPPPPEPAEPGQQPPTSAPDYPTYPTGESGMPGYPQGNQPSAAAVPQPPSIVTAVRLMWAGAALSVVSLLVGLLSLGSIKDNIADNLRNNDNFTQDKLDTAYNVVIITLIVATVIGVALWLWMAHANGAGKKWARIVATVLGALNVLFFLVGLAQGQSTAIQLVFSAINVLLAIAIVVLLWRKESSDFYAARSRPQYR